MKIELDFVPDIIIYFRAPYKGEMHPYHIMERMWGNKSIYENCSKYIESLLPPNVDCWIALQKGTLEYKIIELEIK